MYHVLRNNPTMDGRLRIHIILFKSSGSAHADATCLRVQLDRALLQRQFMTK